MKNSDETNIEWLKDSFKQMQRTQTSLSERVERGFAGVQTSFQELRDLYVDTFTTKSDSHKAHEKIEEMLRNKADKQELENIRQDLENIQSTMTWLVRTIIGALILAGLGLLIYNTSPF